MKYINTQGDVLLLVQSSVANNMNFILQKIGHTVCSLCNHYVMGSSLYVIILGFIGTVSPS